MWREATAGTVEEKKAKLAAPHIRTAMREEYNAGTKSRDFLFGELAEFVVHQVQRVELKSYEGLSVQQIAEREQKPPIDAMLDLSVADTLKTIWLGPIINHNVEHYREIMASPLCSPGWSAIPASSRSKRRTTV